MAKRFRELPEADSQTVLEIVDEITNIGRVSPPTAAERAERQERERLRERRRRERDRVAAEEWARKNQERRRVEQERGEQERRAARIRAAEEAKAAMAAQQQRNQEAAERRQLSQLQHEWATFKFHAAQAQREQQREAAYQEMQQSLENLSRMINPPPEPEPPYISPPDEQGTPRLGYSDFNPELMKQPQRWR
jgi:hypothetical protein